MDPAAQFFFKLKKLSSTLETETERLQLAYENRKKNLDHDDDDGDGRTTGRATRAFHQLECDVRNTKAQVQDQLAQQIAQENTVSSFIKACRLIGEKVTDDIQRVKGHWGMYGYQAPIDTQRSNKTKAPETEVTDKSVDETENIPAGEEEAVVSPSAVGPPSSADLLRTPRLSDFGLSEMQLKRTLAGGEWCAQVPPMPELSLPQPSLNTPVPPPMPITPKCALQMDEDELRTPQMHDFGISEHTMCLNNDFTMDLLRKNIGKPQRPPQDLQVPPVMALMESLQTKADNLESPEPPEFFTAGFKIKKTIDHCTSTAQGDGDPQSLGCPSNLPTTPEIPVFETAYLNSLFSNIKSAQQHEPISTQVDNESHTSQLIHNAATGAERMWEYDVLELSITGLEDKQMPEMPILESAFGKTLGSRSAKMAKKFHFENVETDPAVNRLELDVPTQQFSFGTPGVKSDYQEPSTPEMPDLSSVTQDICKLLSETHLKKAAMATVDPCTRAEKVENSLSLVSESEFQSLPSYLRQMTLNNLNQAVHSINKFMAECQGEKTEFHMEELRRITGVGAKTPVYILCLTELKRLEQGVGPKNTVFKLKLHK